MRKQTAIGRLLVVALVVAVPLSAVPVQAAVGGVGSSPGTAVADVGTPEFVASSLTDQRGDVVPIAVSMSSGTSATVTILGRQTDYEAEVTVKDADSNGRVTIEFNTYLAGSRAAFGTESPGDEITVNRQTAVEGMLPTDLYRLQTGGGEDLADLRIEQRETRALSTMVAPAGADQQLRTRRDVLAYREANNLTKRRGRETAPVAEEDTAVLFIKASGLSGILASQPGDTPTERFRALAESDAVDFTVVQTNPTGEKDPARLLLDREGVRLVPSVRDEAYYLVVDTSSAHYRRGEDGEVRSGLPLGSRFVANLTLSAGSRLTTDGVESVGTAFRVVERSATLSTHEEAGRAFVLPARNQTVRGETTLAPGSTLTVELTARDGEVRKTRTVTVRRDDDALGTFEASFDLQRLGEGETVELTAAEDDTELTGEPTTATVRTPAATLDVGELRTEPGAIYVTAVVNFSRGGLVTVRAYNDSGRLVGTEPVDPGRSEIRVRLQDLPPKGTQLIVSAVRDIDGDGHYTPGVDVAYTESNSPRDLDDVILLTQLPPSPTPTPTPSPTPTATEVTPTATTPTGRTTRTRTESATTTPTDGGSGLVEEVPGFGAATALVAVLLAMLVLRRDR